MITIETFVALIQIDKLCGRGGSRKDFHRLRAAAALAYCAGLWFPEIMALRRHHWMPKGIACILVEGTKLRSARTIPASPATILAMQRHIGASPTTNEDELIFTAAGNPLKNEIQRALRRLGPPAAGAHRAGDLRASFEESMMRAFPNDPLAFYLVGAALPGDVPPIWEDPPLKRLDGMLRRSGHLYKDKDLWRPATRVRALELA